jgi:putative transposase
LIEHDEYLCLDREPIERRAAYRALFKGEVDAAELATIRDASHKGWALGNVRFRDEIQALTQRRVAPSARGRKKRIIDV